MKHLCYVFALLVLGAFGNQARAQGQILWTSGYPVTGSSTGEIDVDGKVEVDTGWAIIKNVVTVYAWREGIEVNAVELSVTGNLGNWSGTISGLDSGETYDLIVEVRLIMCGNEEKRFTVPKTAVAK